MSKEREAFESWAYSKKWNIARVRDKALDQYVDDFVNGAWHGWQAKAQAVPEGFALVPKGPAKDTLIEIASVCIGNDFANLDEAKELYKAMIEAQQPSSTPGCPDEP